MTRYTILLGGELSITPRLKSQIDDSIVFAADGGIRHAEKLDIIPQLWLGDFDSTDSALKKRYQDVEQLVFPVDKDMSDGELAIRTACQRGAEEIILCGAFGGPRLDHALLHITMATTLAQKGIKAILTSGHEEGWPLLPGHHGFDFPKNTRFSLIGFSNIEDLTIEGAKWQLQDAAVDFGSSLTLSNKSESTVFVSLQSGHGVLLATLPTKNI